ncbi:hypothetical protein CTAYLR_000372 [Chrysophaeum taylorii]|uniref:PHD-type domain-containing protein n=1 Tax=Chrysophaeum taylorii TaxID=2483200 RepID=A0AAD7XJV5_9STRA|nr:hypothetical protein CTAYLR_000372 [Chrysophaeum taylorii]
MEQVVASPALASPKRVRKATVRFEFEEPLGGKKKRRRRVSSSSSSSSSKKKKTKAAATSKKNKKTEKKPKSAYMLFVDARLKKGVEKSVIRAEWKALDAAGRAPFAIRSSKQKRRFEEAGTKKRRRRQEKAPVVVVAKKIPTDGSFWCVGGYAPCEVEWKFAARTLDRNRRVSRIDYCDDHCSVCHEGGTLLLCSSCPRAFHRKCLAEHAAEDRTGDLGGRNFAKKRRKSAHAPDPRALVAAPTAAANDDWHCPVCEQSHTDSCVACGEAGDAETRLVPCASCPRAVHFRCGDGLDLVEEGQIAWRCAGCREKPPEEEQGDQDEDVLSKIVALCGKLPRRHFASVWGSRVARARDLERLVDAKGSDAATRSRAALESLHSVEAVCSRLHFAAAPISARRFDRRSIPATDWDCDDGDPARRRAQFAIDGLCVIPGALDAQVVDEARRAATEYYEDALHTVAQLNLEDHLQHGGFATFKSRDRGRFDLVVPGLDRLFDDPPWLPLVKHLVSDDSARLCHVGVIVALPDSAQQKWHSDGDHLHDALHLPPHALNVFVPLVDVDANNGATEFAPGSHLDWATDRKLVLDAKAGDAIIFDWRLKHRGLENRLTSPRPLLYLTYALPWFVDRYNFSSDRYDELPPLIPRTSRADRANLRSNRLLPADA